MRAINEKTKRGYTIIRSKGNVVASWCSAVKPVKVKIDGQEVQMFANPAKSDYIYFRFGSDPEFPNTVRARCIWAKDPKEFDVLKEKSLKVVDWGRDYNKSKDALSAAKAGVKAKATPEPQVKVRPIKVIKKVAQANA